MELAAAEMAAMVEGMVSAVATRVGGERKLS